MASQKISRRRLNRSNSSLHEKKKPTENGGSDNIKNNQKKAFTPSRSMGITERTVKQLKLSNAVTVPENTSVFEASRQIVANRVDALLLTNSNLLCGILTDKDIATRVIARELDLEDTPVSKVMTCNPSFVLSDTLAVEALHKMVQGNFRHLPVVECLYDVIACMERASEKGKDIAATVEGPSTFIETIRERMIKHPLSTIIHENSKVATVSPSHTVLMVSKKMLEFGFNCAVVSVENRPQGILS